MRTKWILLLALSIAACSPSPSTPSVLSSAPIVGPFVPVGESEVRDLGPSTETVWNCGSGGGTIVKHPSRSVATNWAIEWEVGGTAGTGVRIGDGVIPGGVDLSASLEGRYGNQFGQSVQQGTGWDLPAAPNTIVVYTLMWREVWQPGYVDVRLADQSVIRVNVRLRTAILSDVVGKQEQQCTGGQLSVVQPTIQAQPIVTQPASFPQGSQTATQRQQPGPCYGQCWQYDQNARTMVWTGPTDGTEDIWQHPGEALQRIRDGYTAIFTTTVPGEISACVLTINGQTVKNTCDGVLYQIPPGTYRVTSADGQDGGFRWCPLVGYGWRVNGGECK